MHITSSISPLVQPAICYTFLPCIQQAPCPPYGKQSALTHTPRFASSALISAIPGWFQPVASVMSLIEGNKLAELLITDFGAMVTPRTLVEWFKRGFDPARETFFREFSGLFNNTIMAGMLGGLAVGGTYLFKSLNPKAMSLKAHMDVDRVRALSKLMHDILREQGAKLTPQQLQTELLTRVFSGLQSSDPVVTALQEAQPGHAFYSVDKNGQKFATDLRIKLNQESVSGLLNRFMGKAPGFEQWGHQVDDIVEQRLSWPEYQQHLQAVKAKVEQSYRKLLGQQPLSSHQVLELRLRQQNALKKASDKLRLDLRRIVTQEFRALDNTFLNHVEQYALSNHLTHDVLLNQGGEKLLGRTELKDLLKDTKYFMEEIFNRALHEAGVWRNGDKTLGKSGVQQVMKQLFGPLGKQNWLQRHLFVHANDGLVRYVYKSKHWLVVLPVLATAALSSCMVVINNAITRKKYGGKDVYPGEEVFKAPAMGGGVA